MAIDVKSWLQQLGLPQYEPAFRDNEVDGDILPDLTADDLIGLGVTLIGLRRKLLSALAALGATQSRTSPADRDVLRPGAVDGTLHRDGPRRFARCDRVVSEPLQRGDPAL